MSGPVDTSAEAVARAIESAEEHCLIFTAATLRALAAERDALRAALATIAAQNKAGELLPEDRRDADFEGGHGALVEIARAALGRTP